MTNQSKIILAILAGAAIGGGLYYSKVQKEKNDLATKIMQKPGFDLTREILLNKFTLQQLRDMASGLIH